MQQTPPFPPPPPVMPLPTSHRAATGHNYISTASRLHLAPLPSPSLRQAHHCPPPPPPQARKEASHSVHKASQSARELSRSAKTASKSTLEDLTFVGRARLGDITRSAKEAVALKGLGGREPIGGGGGGGGGGSLGRHESLSSDGGRRDSRGAVQRSSGPGGNTDFLSNVSTELNGIAQQTSNLFSDIFGKK